jgi:hypothetical protein
MMKKLSRKNFLQILGVGMSAIALQELPSLEAFADEGTDELNPDDFISEMNAWYQANNLSFRLESISADFEKCSLETISQDIQALQSLRESTEQNCEHQIQYDPSSSTNIQRLAMPVSFSYTTTDSLSVFLDEGTFGLVYIEITVTGIVERQYNSIWSSSGTATEKNGVNLDTLSIGSVTTSDNSPSTGSVSYSCPCSARFAWTSPYSGVKYSGTDSKTISGSFTP